jgi:hypothetical protein
MARDTFSITNGVIDHLKRLGVSVPSHDAELTTDDYFAFWREVSATLLIFCILPATIAVVVWQTFGSANRSRSSSYETDRSYEPPPRVSVTTTGEAPTILSDITREESEFGEQGYKTMRAIHEQTCQCGRDGNCKLKVSRDELRAELARYTESLKTTAPRLWPALTKKMESMSTAEARVYGERLGQDYVNGLARDEVLLWSRMLSTCWGASAEPTRPTGSKARAVGADVPHDGSLDPSGEITDMKNGKMDEPGGVAVFVQGCRRTGGDNPNIDPFCGCLCDYLRVSKPSIIQILRRASKTGDASEMRSLPGVKRCTTWVTDGADGRNPFLKQGMKSSLSVEASFSHCRTSMEKGRGSPEGIVFCNRLVATAP